MAGATPDPDPDGDAERGPPRILLAVVRSACPALQVYAPGPLRHWHDLVNAAETVRPMLGISPSAWSEARAAMGSEQAAVVVAALLERAADLRSPGGYLRALTAKAEANAFSCGPMVMALLRRGKAGSPARSQL